MKIHFDNLIKKKPAINYFDDTIKQSQSENEMFTIIKEYHTSLHKVSLKAAPDKTFFFLEKEKILGHVQMDYNLLQYESGKYSTSSPAKLNVM